MENSNSEEWIKIEQYGMPDGEFIVTSFIQDIEGVVVFIRLTN